ncbi:MAG: TPM domain-containing protein [Candidatus Azobacteroides sp.]|nr:TPM domain-containing protein [Candidatus Azobacteroides sp.]
MNMKRSVFIFLFCVLGSLYTHAYTVKTVPNPKKISSGHFVSNPDGILTGSVENELNNLLQMLEQETSTEVAVVAVESIGDAPIHDFGTKLFNYWGIGKAWENKGVLVLLVTDQRTVRFVTGYGMESILSDDHCLKIQNETMIPEFKKGNYSKGILKGVKDIDYKVRTILLPEEEVIIQPTGKTREKTNTNNTTKKEQGKKNNNQPVSSFFPMLLICIFYNFLFTRYFGRYLRKLGKRQDLQKQEAVRLAKGRNNLFTIIFSYLFLFIILITVTIIIGDNTENTTFLYIIFFVIVAMFFQYSYGDYLIKKFAADPVKCKKCTGNMIEVTTPQEKRKYLNESQIVEEELKSISHFIYVCDVCGHIHIFRRNIYSSPYRKCPECNVKSATVTPEATVIREPTEYSTGLKKRIYICRYCNCRIEQEEITPKLRAYYEYSGSSSYEDSSYSHRRHTHSGYRGHSSGSSSSSRGSSSSSSSGRTSSSSGRSSSSSGSKSFGGGRSGGSGASSSW